MLDLAWVSGGFAVAALGLYFNAEYLSGEVAAVRDKVFNETLQGVLASGSSVTPSELMEQLGQAFGVSRTSDIVALLADVQPNGYRKAIGFFSGASAVALIGSLFPRPFTLMEEAGWFIAFVVLFVVLFSAGLLVLYDDTKYYVRLFRIRRTKGEFPS